MASPESEPRRLECLSFISAGTPEADAARADLAKIYGDCDPNSSDVVVALGGDGLMLQTLHRFMGRNKPIYGMNRGSVGFLLNEFRLDGLRERLAAAKASIVHPLTRRGPMPPANCTPHARSTKSRSCGRPFRRRNCGSSSIKKNGSAN